MNKRKIHVVLLLVVSIFAAGTIAFGVVAGAQGGVLAKYENDIALLLDKKTKLTTALFRATSLTQLTQLAQSEGWMTPSRLAYVDRGETTAAAQ